MTRRKVAGNACDARMLRSKRVIYSWVSLVVASLLVGLPGVRLTLLNTLAESRAADSLQALAPGNSIARELASAEIHSYQIILNAGQYLHITIEQHGISVGLTLQSPTGQTPLQLDCRADGPTPLSLIAETSGAYKLEVRSLEEDGTRGRYDLKVEGTRAATDRDKSRVMAEKTVAEADRQLKEERAESSRLAISRFKDSLPLWRAAGDVKEEVRTLKRIGDAYQPLGEYKNALASYNQALALNRNLKDRAGESATLNEMSYAHIQLGETPRALNFCTRALKLSQATGNRSGQAEAINNIAEVHYWSGRRQQALVFYRQALSLWTGLADRKGQAQSYTYLGFTYSDLGQMNEALGFYQQALALWERIHDRHGQAITLTALGRLYSRMGESQKALDFFEKAAPLMHEIGDPLEEGRVFNGMAYVYNGLGEKQRALEYYDRGLALFRAAHNRNGEAMTLGDAGAVYYSLGDYQKALEYHQQALAIFKATGYRRLEIFELKEIGRIYDARGDKEKALENYSLARDFYQKEKDLRGATDTLNLMGRIYEGWGQKEKSLNYYRHALAPSRKAEYRFGEAQTLDNIARVERDLHHLAAARKWIEESISVIESLRTKVVSEDLRATYFASAHQSYELYIDVLMQLRKERPADEGLDALAFDVSERARARSLLETLCGGQIDIQGVDRALLERERSLQGQLNAKTERRMQLLTGQHNDAEAAQLAKEIEGIINEYDSVKSQIKAQSPHYAALMQPEPLKLNEVQQQVLDDKSLLLEYSLGDERSYLWTVTKNEVTGYELPPRAEIESAAHDLYESLVARQPLKGESFEQHQERIARADAQYWQQAESLSRMVLGPVAERLEEKRLLIVPDGALQYIPFDALTIPDSSEQASSQKNEGTAGPLPLILKHEIVNQPSASALALMRSETKRREPRTKEVAVLADPVFGSDDPRVSASGKPSDAAQEIKAPAELTRSLRDIGVTDEKGGIQRLLASRQEAETIMALVPRGAGLKALGFDASKQTLLGADLSQYKIIHLATHAILDNENPESSGIVLSRVDRNGKPQDGILGLYDIYNLHLPVDLVVLSACQTGLGKEIKGEGLVGLTRGFMYAGASSVMASLWKVDDDATAELMGYFYESLLKEGSPPAAALRNAQIKMWQQKQWRAPYFWAAFVLQGEYQAKPAAPRPQQSLQLSAYKVAAPLLLPLTMFVVCAWLIRRRRVVGN